MPHFRFVITLSCISLVLVVGCSYFIATPSPIPLPTALPTSTFASPATPTRGIPSATPTVAVSFTATAVRPSPTATRTQTRTATSTRTIAPTPTKTLAPSGPLTRIDTHFKSAALDLDRRIVVYLPPGYNESPQRRYPVLYMLHGYGGFVDPSPEWEKWGLKDIAESMMNKQQIQPMIIVQPYGYMLDGQPSFFFNHSPAVGGQRWGDFIWQDTVRYVDTNYRTIAKRTSRAIGGYSLGGQGALSLALTHPEVFSIVGGHSSSFRGADGTIAVINDWNWYNQYDPIWLVQNTNAAQQLSIWLDVGTDDDNVRNCGANSNRCVEAFHQLLVARGIPHEWHDTWLGPHEGVYWSSHLPDYLTWYSNSLTGQ